MDSNTIRKSLFILFILTVFSSSLSASWSSWDYLGNVDGVSLYTRKDSSNGYSRIQLKMENSNSYNVTVRVIDPTFTTSSGDIELSSEQHSVGANSTKTNTAWSVRGDVTYIQLKNVIIERR